MHLRWLMLSSDAKIITDCSKLTNKWGSPLFFGSVLKALKDPNSEWPTGAAWPQDIVGVIIIMYKANGKSRCIFIGSIKSSPASVQRISDRKVPGSNPENHIMRFLVADSIRRGELRKQIRLETSTPPPPLFSTSLTKILVFILISVWWVLFLYRLYRLLWQRIASSIYICKLDLVLGLALQNSFKLVVQYFIALRPSSFKLEMYSDCLRQWNYSKLVSLQTDFHDSWRIGEGMNNC